MGPHETSDRIVPRQTIRPSYPATHLCIEVGPAWGAFNDGPEMDGAREYSIHYALFPSGP